jgi:hypothetical protein
METNQIWRCKAISQMLRKMIQGRTYEILRASKTQIT